jgi:fructokinase
MIRIGVDLGGTKISAIALDEAGATRGHLRVATPREDYAGTIAAIRGLVGRLEDENSVTGASVGISMPGALSVRTGLVKNANSTWLNGQPFDRDLAAALSRPVRVANDANCLAVSEATDGAGAGAHLVFAVILGTGCGGGIAVDGRPITGLNAIAGEWGHNPLPWPTPAELPGRPCYCGRQGCIETWLSGPGLADHHRAEAGQDLTAQEIAARATAGDGAATASLMRHRNRLARSLASVINVLDPDMIVVGGGISRIDALYAGLSEEISAWCFSDGVSTPVVAARHGDDSGVRGAAWLWPRGDEERGRS